MTTQDQKQCKCALNGSLPICGKEPAIGYVGDVEVCCNLLGVGTACSHSKACHQAEPERFTPSPECKNQHDCRASGVCEDVCGAKGKEPPEEKGLAGRFSKRELYLMEKAFETAGTYGSMQEWLDTKVFDSVTIAAVLDFESSDLDDVPPEPEHPDIVISKLQMLLDDFGPVRNDESASHIINLAITALSQAAPQASDAEIRAITDPDNGALACMNSIIAKSPPITQTKRDEIERHYATLYRLAKSGGGE